MTKRSVRGPGAALVVVAAGLGLSGCAMLSPVQTQIPYQPAAGVAVDLGPIRIDNLLVVAPLKGGPGTVSASIVNSTGQEVAVQFADVTSQSTARVTAAPGVATQVSAPGSTVQLAQVSSAPGSNITLDVTTAATGTAVVTVPVLATQAFLQDLQPTPMPTTGPILPTPGPTSATAGS